LKIHAMRERLEKEHMLAHMTSKYKSINVIGVHRKQSD